MPLDSHSGLLLRLCQTLSSSDSSTRSQTRRYHPKTKECNLWAAACSMIVIVILCTALAEPNWIVLQGGGCSLDSIGVYYFFYHGYFEVPIGRVEALTIYHITTSAGDEKLVNCVTPRVVAIFKSIIGLTFFGIICSIAAFLLDLLGPRNKLLKNVRRHAVFNVVTVLICIVITGFCFWATGIILRLQNFSKPHLGSKVVVTFDVSFYLVVTAGAMSVIATACNCLKRHQPLNQDDESELLGDIDDVNGVRPLGELPPPAYIP